MIRINEVKVDVLAINDKNKIKEAIAKHLNIKSAEIDSFIITKRALDARNKQNLHYKYNFDISLPKQLEEQFLKNRKALPSKLEEQKPIDKVKTRKSVMVVGSGPSGLFCALTLAKAGVKVIVLERGQCVEKRVKTVEAFLNEGRFSSQTNIQFGEGGAGTFSDGKLNTGINSSSVKDVLMAFYQNGAPEEILFDSKPHIGTDKLRNVVRNIRNQIINLGGEFLFETKFVDFEYSNNKIKAFYEDEQKTNSIVVDDIVLALGYSARDTLRRLYSKGMEFKQKPFSVGYRIEHLQSDINKSQYGESEAAKLLPWADYKLFVHLPNGRTVYTFCMCPGGEVVPAISNEGEIVTNGMSYHARDGKNANSALLVSVDCSDYNSEEPLAGMDYQERLEKEAYRKGNGKFICSLVGDFLQNKPTNSLQKVVPTVKPWYTLGNVSDLLPKQLSDSIKQALPLLGKKLKGFDDPAAVLTGIETRSSAPFMIPRNQELSTNFEHVYAVGEGAGMAGGIVSSAVDGVKIAKKIIENYIRG